jgi:hypothetical protein
MVARATWLSTGGGDIEDGGQLKRCGEEERGLIHGLSAFGHMCAYVCVSRYFLEHNIGNMRIIHTDP